MICLKLFLLLLSFALFSLCSSQEEADFLKSGLRQLKKKKNEGYDNEIPVVEGYVVQEEKKKKSHHVGKGHIVHEHQKKLPEAKKIHPKKPKFVEEKHVIVPSGLYAPVIPPVHPIGTVEKHPFPLAEQP